VAALLVFALLASREDAHAGPVTGPALMAGGLMLALVVIRLAAALHEHQHVAVRWRRLNENVEAMLTAIDTKDRYTRRHSEHVTEYARWIADELRLPRETRRMTCVGGLLHDIGKIGVPDTILQKPGRLSAEEWEVMKGHPSLGALMLRSVPGLEGVIDAVRSHHERWDGRGYPDGLAGENIPLLGRILAVADAFSAMTTDRPYRKGMAWEAALGEIRANSGTQFDPTLAHAFLAAAEQRQPAGGTRPPAEAYREPGST
jgi:putative nucleotidyltransferase with HDIG domain